MAEAELVLLGPAYKLNYVMLVGAQCGPEGKVRASLPFALQRGLLHRRCVKTSAALASSSLQSAVWTRSVVTACSRTMEARRAGERELDVVRTGDGRRWQGQVQLWLAHRLQIVLDVRSPQGRFGSLLAQRTPSQCGLSVTTASSPALRSATAVAPLGGRDLARSSPRAGGRRRAPTRPFLDLESRPPSGWRQVAAGPAF